MRAGGIRRRPAADPWIRNSIPLLTFVALGLPAGAIGVAWPYMRASFGAPLAGLGLLLATLTLAYLPAKEWEIRGEVRFDKSDQSAFLKSDGVTPTSNQHSAGVEVLYKF